jgi:hypothetical protein
MNDLATLLREMVIVYIDKYLVLISWMLRDMQRTIESVADNVPPEIRKEKGVYPILDHIETLSKELKEDILFIRSGGKEVVPSPPTQERSPLDLPLANIQTTLEEIRALQRSQKSPTD